MFRALILVVFLVPAELAHAQGVDADAAPDAAARDASAPRPRFVRKLAVLHLDPPSPFDPADSISRRYGSLPGDAVFARSQQVTDDLRSATRGLVDYQLELSLTIREFPLWQDGSRYDWQSFEACRTSPDLCRNGETSYHWLMREATGRDLCAAIEQGAIDEVWVWAPGYFAFDEFAFKIPEDRVSYPPEPYNPWIYDLRRKDLPECARTYFVMAFNTERPGAEVLHSFGHRIESAITASAPAHGRWGSCDGSSEWTHFACVHKDIPGGAAGCGNVHFPPNALTDYEYGSERLAPSSCDAWLQYPDIPPEFAFMNRDTWSRPDGDHQMDFLRWWFAHIPQAPGSHDDGGIEIRNNWWHYILCYDRPCTDADAAGDAGVSADDVCEGALGCRPETTRVGGCATSGDTSRASVLLVALAFAARRRRIDGNIQD